MSNAACEAVIHEYCHELQLFVLVIVILSFSYNLLSVATDTCGQLNPLKFSFLVYEFGLSRRLQSIMRSAGQMHRKLSEADSEKLAGELSLVN
jgi:hypothetical protein